ncbi:secretion protein [Flavobacterium luteum]|uniref:Secretion protein n=1 Tax=Flavobacterium luteum TaxID=2026654 RepID=A0A7J5AFD6_9FLAO|nr:secretion protein [Flavobacterium luteum]KAB1155699.1 secretion protein [Flavobacterium luteum]
MKKIIKLSIVFAFVLTTIGTYASEENSFLSVRKGNEKEIKVSLNGINKAKVSIYDEEDNLIYSEIATGKEGVSKIYNLEEFPEGTYYFVVETCLKKVKHEIIINGQEISNVTAKEIL